LIPAEQDGSVQISVLPCAWLMAGNMLRLRERATGQLLPTPEEAALAERDTAREGLARLRAELAQLRGEGS